MKRGVILLLSFCVAALAVSSNQADNTTEENSDRSIDEVRDGIIEVKDTVQNCYELLLADDPNLAGDIEVSFSITPEGSVVDIMIECSEGLENLEDPVGDAVGDLVFLPCSDQNENLPVTVPFSLSPPQGE